MGKAQIQPRTTEQTPVATGIGAKGSTPPDPAKPPDPKPADPVAPTPARYDGLAFCADGAQFPWHAVFGHLRDEWKRVNPDRSWGDLAESLGVRSQKVSQWATGSDPTQIPPSWVIMRLCHDLGVTIVWAPGKVDLIRTGA